MILTDKVALVASSRNGIGEAVASLMARYGARVVVGSPGGAAAGGRPARIVQAIGAAGGHAVACHEDLATMAGGERAVQCALEAFGRLDILVNGADGVRSRSIFDLAEDSWDAEITPYLKAQIACTRPAAAVFRQQGKGRIISFTSDAGLVGAAGQASNAAAEGAVTGLARVAALDLGKYGVTANTIVLGGKAGPHAGNTAALAVYLASDSAASISGQTFRVEGSRIALVGNPRPIQAIYNAQRWTMQELVAAIPAHLSPAFFHGTDFSTL